ncbi:hypothetical protein V2J09_016401 [Rumex salicifolius]
MGKHVEDCGSSSNGDLQGQVSKAQIMNALREREEGESRERYRERLWCYLFENLNRVVDELYLLCELECDREQLREAILILEEATSDFRELNTRVEEFDNTKKSASNVSAITVKADRRRPHALSWEVRRMTTSPHRAEILSSSLEVFKKIQEEREKTRVPNDLNIKECQSAGQQLSTIDTLNKSSAVDAESELKSRKNSDIADPVRTNIVREKKSIDFTASNKLSLARTNRLPSQCLTSPNFNGSKLPSRGTSAGKNKREQVASLVAGEKSCSSVDLGSQNSVNYKEKEKEIEKEKRSSASWKSMNAWKEKRNWEEILASPCRVSSRVSHSPCMSRRSAERTRILHDKLMTPDKKKKTSIDLKREAEEKHARARRIKREFENERVQKLQRTSEKLNRVTEWQAVRSMKLKEGMYARHQRSETRHEAYIAQVVKRAGEESIKVNEVRFITSLNEENKKFMLHQKLHVSEMRRAEKLHVLKIKQKEDMAREEAVLERRKILEAEKLQRLAVTQRKKEEAQARREEERKASSAAREAKAIEQRRKREERVKARQEEAELLAQKLAERLRESEQRRRFYLEQIRERASMDFRDHSSPLTRRSLSKDGQGRLAVACSGEDNQISNVLGTGDSNPAASNPNPQHMFKRRIKKIRQRLMSLKHNYPELSVPENSGLGYRTAITTARARISRWLQDLQRYRQARKEGASSIGLISAEMIKFLEGKELELHASRQAGLLDFISSALPASHTSKPEACQVTIYLLRLLKVILALPTNRSYFLAQNLLPPTIPMLSAALENYIKFAASLNSPASSVLPTNKTSDIFDSISEVLDGFLCTVTMIIGHESSDEREYQMQAGLLELVVSYQIIHRLRDLFALHDRPQVEGSPFPSSILLSINLLVALTSRSRVVSSIDFVGSVINSSIKEPKGPHALDRNSAKLHNASMDEQFKTEESIDPVSGVGRSKEQPNSHLTELIDVVLGTTAVLDGSKRNCSAVTCKSSNPLKEDMEIGVGTNDETSMCLKAPEGILLSAISETGLVSLLSLLTAVLLQANNRTSEQSTYVLPSNFAEVAISVLKVLNKLALMDLTFLQEMLVGFLLLESLLLLSYFSLFHPGNQAVLRWGKGTTILHKVCDLPFTFFSDPELMPVLAGTLVAACFRCEQNRGVVQQELSTEMLLSLVNSCKNSSQPPQSSPAEDSSEGNQINIEPSRKLQTSDLAQRFGRFSARATTTRSSLARSNVQCGCVRGGRLKSNKENRIGNRLIDEACLKERISAPALMLHSRFPVSFMDRVEQFFSAEIACMDEECA